MIQGCTFTYAFAVGKVNVRMSCWSEMAEGSETEARETTTMYSINRSITCDLTWKRLDDKNSKVPWSFPFSFGAVLLGLAGSALSVFSTTGIAWKTDTQRTTEGNWAVSILSWFSVYINDEWQLKIKKKKKARTHCSNKIRNKAKAASGS